MINLREGSIIIGHKLLGFEGTLAHPPKDGNPDEWKPFKGDIAPIDMIGLYACLTKLLRGELPMPERNKPSWGKVSQSGRVSLYPVTETEIKNRYLAFLIASNTEQKTRTRFPINDLTVRSILHLIELASLQGEQACIINGSDGSQLAIIRNSSTLSFITPVHHLELDVAGRTLLLSAVEHLLEKGEIRPFKYHDLAARNGGKRTGVPIPMVSIKGELFRIEPEAALKIKLLCL